MNIFKIQSVIGFYKNYNRRKLWGYLNIAFNGIDNDRLKLLGPDRVCAEWLLRNGAAVKWTKEKEFLKDYNELPLEDAKNIIHIKEVDASDSSISDYGFGHFLGCNHIDTLILHNCQYLDDPALSMLQPLNETLKYLRVSSCHITDDGLNAISTLGKLEKLVIGNLPYLNDKDNLISNLNKHLPKCHITFIDDA